MGSEDDRTRLGTGITGDADPAAGEEPTELDRRPVTATVTQAEALDPPRAPIPTAQGIGAVSPTATDVEALPAGARALDPLASIHDAETAAQAAHVRAEALERANRVRDNIDVNATIVTRRAATAAEHVRDMAFDKIRDGSDEDLRETFARPAHDPKRASSLDHRADPKRASALDHRAADPKRTSALDHRAADPKRTSALDHRAADPKRASALDHRAASGDSDWMDRFATQASNGRDNIPPLDEHDQALVAELRALPPEGNEPDWTKLEASIRDQVRDRPLLPWWRTWRFVAPLGALAVTALIAVVVMKSSKRAERTSHVTTPRESAPPTERPAPPTGDVAPMMWLDGEPLELDEVDPADLDELGAITLAPDGDTPRDDDALDMTSDSELLESADHGILPVTDYGWLDRLDDAAFARAEIWLAGKRS